MTPPRVRVGVLGWPVAHSLSPAMHNAALNAVGLAPNWRYQLLPVPPEVFEETVRALPNAGFRGANVTIPHKERALALADTATPRAQAIGAANTLIFEGHQIAADNTDAPALIEAIPDPNGMTALVLGAGGSARAAVWALLDAGASEVRLWNRTPARAIRLAEDLGATPVPTAEPADLLINCTSIGLDSREEAFKELPITADAVSGYLRLVDYVYTGETETELLQAARARSIPVVDGLELLVRQGALSFAQFTGRKAPAEAMRAAVSVR